MTHALKGEQHSDTLQAAADLYQVLRQGGHGLASEEADRIADMYDMPVPVVTD